MTMIYTYWISTILLSLLYLASATLYTMKTNWVKEQFTAFGYPSYLVKPLIFCKTLAVIVVISRFNTSLTDFTYAAMTLHLMLAIGAHWGVKKPKEALPAIVGVLLIAASFTTQNAARNLPSANSAGASFITETVGKNHE